MTEQVQEALAEVDSAQAPEVTATSDVASPAPEVAESQPEQQPEEKKFSQAEIDAMISKRLAREQRKWERQQAQRQADKPSTTEPPEREQFESDDAYVQALATRKAEELIAQKEAQRQQAELLDAYHEREEEARNKYEDFEQVVYNPALRITDAMAQSIQASEIGPEVAYYLGANPKEADRISRLSPLLQAKEIGKIEVKLATSPPVQKTSSAPAPINPVTARSSGNPSYDTTDPRSTKAMGVSEWIEAERQRQIRKMQAQYQR
jgi:hypothetical protein